jgi:hypothetical protein
MSLTNVSGKTLEPSEDMDKDQAPQGPTETSKPVTQVIGDRYVDFDKLRKYLEHTFGADKSSCQVFPVHWIPTCWLVLLLMMAARKRPN